MVDKNQTSDFKKEERYIVVKLKDLAPTKEGALRDFLKLNSVPTRECVVVEKHWPIFEKVWGLIEGLGGKKFPHNNDHDDHSTDPRYYRDGM